MFNSSEKKLNYQAIFVINNYLVMSDDKKSKKKLSSQKCVTTQQLEMIYIAITIMVTYVQLKMTCLITLSY